MSKSSLVYSTDDTKKCPTCGNFECTCKTVKSGEPLAGQTAKLRIERKGRKGKSVTIVDNLNANPFDLADLAKKLKQYCGTGGTIKDGKIEIQGEQRDKVAEKLKKLGLKVKYSGG